MEIWLSAEAQDDVDEELRHAQNKVERLLAPIIKGGYGSEIETWAVITILRPTIPKGWGEVYKYHHDDRSVEFRLIIDYEKFKISNSYDRTRMLIHSISRSIDLFSLLKVQGFNIGDFRDDILKAVEGAGF